MVRNRRHGSSCDGSELLYGDIVVQGGLDGCPCVADECWWVLRVAVEVFDEFWGVVAWLLSGFENEADQVDAEVPLAHFVFFSFGHVTWEALAAEMSPALKENGVTTAVSM